MNHYDTIVTGKFLKIVQYELEADEYLGEPVDLIARLKKNKIKADIFTFVQRVPETQPKYNYIMEWSDSAVLYIESYDNWWKNCIDAKTRNMVRKAEKKGVRVEHVLYDEKLLEGIIKIYNESPTRQGKPFRQYGIDLQTADKQFSKYLEKSDFIGAYLDDELIGFIRLIYDGNQKARTAQIIAMIKHRDKAPTNALIAKAVEMCEKQKIPYLEYGVWSEGTLGDFKRNNAFVKMDIPRYYVPLSLKGRFALKLGLHRKIKSILPSRFVDRLIRYRSVFLKKRS